jgi:hypothetical protein
VWARLDRMRLPARILGELLAHSEALALAMLAQRQHASFNKEEELPAHRERKTYWKLSERGLTLAMQRVASSSPADFARVTTLVRNHRKLISGSENDALKWREKRARTKIGSIAHKAERLARDVTELCESPSLMMFGGRALTNERFKGLRETLRAFAAELNLCLDRPSQAETWAKLRRSALHSMVQCLGPRSRRPNWRLLADLVHLASQKGIEISADTLRKEHQSTQ